MPWTCCKRGCGRQNDYTSWCQGCGHNQCHNCQVIQSAPAPAAKYNNQPASYGGNANIGWNNPYVQAAPPQYGYHNHPAPSPYGTSSQVGGSGAIGWPGSFHAPSSNAYYPSTALAPAPTAPTGGSAYAYPHGPQSAPQQSQAYGAQPLALPSLYPYPLAGNSAGVSAPAAAGSTQGQGSGNNSGTGYTHPWASGGSGGPDQSGRH